MLYKTGLPSFCREITIILTVREQIYPAYLLLTFAADCLGGTLVSVLSTQVPETRHGQGHNLPYKGFQRIIGIPSFKTICLRLASLATFV